MSVHTELLPESLPQDPLPLLELWMQQAWEQRLQPNPNAMVLATSDGAGGVSARVVLCKKLHVRPGYVVFYTNYRSLKGRQLEQNPRAAAVIHWDALHRQVRIEGPVIQGPPSDSDEYFASRPWQSRLGAWASVQSEPVASREHLKQAVLAMAERFGTPPPEHQETARDAEIAIPRPPHWGGYQLWIEKLELWVEGEARIHDRARWTRPLGVTARGSFDPGPWTASRLQP
jgi:pyridoxamine 5'-phosphate oxidase